MFKPPWGQHPVPLEKATTEPENVYEKMAQAESEEAEAKVEEAESQTPGEETKEPEAPEANPSDSWIPDQSTGSPSETGGIFF